MSDDEISIDFSKVKSFFKSKKEKKEKSEQSGKTKETKDDEVTIDFSKITNLFKGSKDSSKKSSDEKTLDFQSLKPVLNLFSKYKIIFLILIPLLVSVLLRSQPAFLPLTDDWAESTVYNYHKNTIRTQIDQNYPTLPADRKQVIVDEQFDILLKQQKPAIEAQIDELSNQFKDQMRDEQGQTYLLAIDPYYWLRFVENIEENGHYGDILVDGKPYDNHFLAPIGRFIGEDDFHIEFEYYVYKFLNFFDKEMYPMRVAFYVPLILASLCVIPAFFIARKIGGDIAGFFAAMFVAIHPAFLTRTVAGFADTDAYNVLFPLLITWIFLEAFDSKKRTKTFTLSTLAGLLVGLYSSAWGGWWYIFDFLLGASGIFLGYYILIHLKTIKSRKTKKVIFDAVLLIVIFIFSTMIFTSLATSFTNFTRVYSAPLSFIQIKEVAKLSIWPNVYTTVAEQNEITIKGAISQIGGNLVFLLSVIGIMFTLMRKDKHGKMDIRYAVLLGIWFFATMYATTKGVRYVMLLVPAFSIAFGIFVGITTRFVSNYMAKELAINKNIAKISLIIIFGLLLIAPFNRAVNTAKNELPSMNDAWVRSLEKIKDNSNETAIINSWWDFGHWFKYWADRPVTFDGTSQTGARAHWIGKTLLTDNETQAIGILRMLDCGGNTAFEKINLKLEELESIDLINELVLVDKAEAKIILSEHFNAEETEEILKLTHCNPPEDFFIASEDMVAKSGVWAHFGSWDFEKASMVFEVKQEKPAQGKQILVEQFGLSEEQADEFYYQIQTQDTNTWIAPWPGYYSQPANCNREKDLISCANGLNLNLTSKEAYVQTPQGRIRPATFSYIDEWTRFRVGVHTKNVWRTEDGKIVAAAFFRKGADYQSILMDPALTASMFTRLFFFQGVGLKHFDRFHGDQDISGLDIYVYEVDWEGD